MVVGNNMAKVDIYLEDLNFQKQNQQIPPGNRLSVDGKVTGYIKSRTAQAKIVFIKKKRLLTSRNVRIKVRKNRYKHFVSRVIKRDKE